MNVSSVMKAMLAVGAICAGLIMGLTQCSSVDVDEPSERRQASSRYGAYLAGRFAAGENDAASAALFYDKALTFDPDNSELLERAIMSEVADGDLDGAAKHAQELVSRVHQARVARLVLAVRAMRDGGYARARAEFEKVSGNAATEIVARLGLAYAHLAEGKPLEAVRIVDKLTENRGARPFALYHLGVIEDLSGRTKEALRRFEEANRLSEGGSLRILVAYCALLARTGEPAKAKALYSAFLRKAPSHPVVRAALTRLEAGNVPERVIANAKHGLAETLYGIASSLSDDSAFEIPVFYLQLALSLEPRHEVALTLLGDRYESSGRLSDAVATYERIPLSSPLYLNARVQIAQTYQKQKKTAQALQTLNAAVSGNDDDIDLFASIGDIERGDERYAEAIAAYSKAIGLVRELKEGHWTLFYTRGIALERSKRWSEAERDLQQALKLKPEQPLVLNYLAYTWVEQGVNLQEALSMLKRAVEIRPEDGFIIDSLGWAYYRVGDYKAAIQYLEQAIQLEPSEATINDHLGDAYWRVGRRLEAKYQWQHALTLKPEQGEEPKIKKKIEQGLLDLPPAPAQAGTPQAGQ